MRLFSQKRRKEVIDILGEADLLSLDNFANMFNKAYEARESMDSFYKTVDSLFHVKFHSFIFGKRGALDHRLFFGFLYKDYCSKTEQEIIKKYIDKYKIKILECYPV